MLEVSRMQLYCMLATLQTSTGAYACKHRPSATAFDERRCLHSRALKAQSDDIWIPKERFRWGRVLCTWTG
jgi:hypothetical protein